MRARFVLDFGMSDSRAHKMEGTSLNNNHNYLLHIGHLGLGY